MSNHISDVPHAWANKNGDYMSVSNLYFRGTTIYSYGSHFPIASHVECNGRQAVLFTYRTNSKSTARHINLVKDASSHLKRIYCYNPVVRYGSDMHEENTERFVSLLENIAEKLEWARRKEKYLLQLQSESQNIREYFDFFCIPVPVNLQRLMEISGSEEYTAYLKDKEKLIKAEKRKRKAKALKQYRERLARWLSGETGYFSGREENRDYLRIRNGAVQTSQGVEIPMNVARDIYQRLLNQTLKVGDHILSYTVSAINGDLRVGCHTFPKAYLLEFGKTLP